MKQLIEFIPLIIFFVLYKMYDIYVATGALIVATAIQIVLTFIVYRKFEKMQLITFVMVAVFGGMTLFLQDESFIKWKVTIVYLVFAIGLFVTQLMGKPLIKGMLAKEISLPDSAWSKINYAWIVFFSFCAALNVYVAFTMSLDIWVNFKVFGLLAATFGFMILTGIYIYKQMPKDQQKDSQD
ncbi:septation protein A [Vibrio sp. vnigr-6D03]|uniref:septation protein A n=1 Tax=Vibrio sp. vnigr-6D03 TaxID=2058088 RepID=UPI000C31BCB3|nr:septation protein A [Vibrio sp. vnigr-6D03]PKF76701.1 septation protein A [Vibrio sp. vnigr-6D03]